MLNIPTRINGFALGAPPQLLHGHGPNVLQMIGAGARDDGVPDDGRVGGVCAGRRGPFGRDVDEELFRVPCEQGGEVRVEGELDDGVFFFFGRVVVGAAFDAVFFFFFIPLC